MQTVNLILFEGENNIQMQSSERKTPRADGKPGFVHLH